MKRAINLLLIILIAVLASGSAEAQDTTFVKSSNGEIKMLTPGKVIKLADSTDQIIFADKDIKKIMEGEAVEVLVKAETVIEGNIWKIFPKVQIYKTYRTYQLANGEITSHSEKTIIEDIQDDASFAAGMYIMLSCIGVILSVTTIRQRKNIKPTVESIIYLLAINIMVGGGFFLAMPQGSGAAILGVFAIMILATGLIIMLAILTDNPFQVGSMIALFFPLMLMQILRLDADPRPQNIANFWIMINVCFVLGLVIRIIIGRMKNKRKIR